MNCLIQWLPNLQLPLRVKLLYSSFLSLSLFVFIASRYSLVPVPGFIYMVFLVPSCTTAFLFLQMFSLQKREKHGRSAGLEDKRWGMLLNTLPCGAGSTGQPQHGAAVDIQTSYTMGGNYRIASRNPHISYFFSTDHKRVTFREIFFLPCFANNGGWGWRGKSWFLARLAAGDVEEKKGLWQSQIAALAQHLPWTEKDGGGGGIASSTLSSPHLPLPTAAWCFPRAQMP